MPDLRKNENRDEYDADDDLYRGWQEAIAAIRDRMTAGGPGYSPDRPAEAAQRANEKGEAEASPSPNRL